MLTRTGHIKVTETPVDAAAAAFAASSCCASCSPRLAPPRAGRQLPRAASACPSWCGHPWRAQPRDSRELRPRCRSHLRCARGASTTDVSVDTHAACSLAPPAHAHRNHTLLSSRLSLLCCSSLPRFLAWHGMVGPRGVWGGCTVRGVTQGSGAGGGRRKGSNAAPGLCARAQG